MTIQCRETVGLELPTMDVILQLNPSELKMIDVLSIKTGEEEVEWSEVVLLSPGSFRAGWMTEVSRDFFLSAYAIPAGSVRDQRKGFGGLTRKSLLLLDFPLRQSDLALILIGYTVQ